MFEIAVLIENFEIYKSPITFDFVLINLFWLVLNQSIALFFVLIFNAPTNCVLTQSYVINSLSMYLKIKLNSHDAGTMVDCPTNWTIILWSFWHFEEMYRLPMKTSFDVVMHKSISKKIYFELEFKLIMDLLK